MENINKLVDLRVNKLNNSNKTFKDIYDVMFSNPNYIFAEDNDGYKINEYSFKYIDEKINDIAYSINIKYPNLKNQFIGIALDTSVEWTILFFAILKSNNKPYLINLRHPDSLVNSLLKDLNIEYVIGNQKKYDANLIEYNTLDLKADINYEFKFENEIALSTSATTLKHKIIIYNGLEISEQILNCVGILKNNKQIKKHYKGRLKQLVFLPLYHIFGLIATFIWFSFFGRTMVFLKDYNSSTILNTIKKHEVTHIFAVPLFWNTIEKEILNKLKDRDEKTNKKFIKGQKLTLKLQKAFPNKGINLSKKIMEEITNELFGPSVMFCITGGAYIKDSTLKLINSLGYPLYNGYGMSEVGITSVELGNVKDRLKNSIGKPFGSIEYKIDNNVLFIRGKSISHKMIIDNKLIDNIEWFNTNDIFHKDDDNRYYIDGRLDDLFIGENGENINPDLIEKEFNLNKINRLSILNINNTLSLIIEINKLTPKNVIKDIYDEANNLNNNLDISLRFKQIYFTYDPIQSALAIKVSRQYLIKKLNDNEIKLFKFNELDLNTDTKYDENIMNKVIECFKNSLNKDEININDNFFYDLEGSSLDYFDLISTINEEFNVNISYDLKLESPIDFTKEIERILSL